MKKNIYKTQSGITIDLNNFDEVDAHLDELTNEDWMLISKNKKLLEDFIVRYEDFVKWYYISRYQKLSEDFIELYADKLDWIGISQYQKLSEPFVEKHIDKLDPERIVNYQDLSKEFINKHAGELFYEDTIIVIEGENKVSYVF
jgi:hypothetical protein